MPTRRPLNFASFDAAIADVENLRQHGYARAGNWSLEQAADHLARFMAMSIDGFPATPFSITIKLARLMGPLLLRRTLKTRSIPAGFRGPDAFMPGAACTSASIDAFITSARRVRDHTGAFVPSPLFGAISPEQWRQIHLIHAAHHLSFLIPNPA